MTKFFAIAFAATLFACVDARMTRMRSGSSCHCRHRIQNERDDAIKKHNEVANDIDVLKAFVTTSSCKPGYEFNYDNSKLDKKAILCDKCPDNYYRAAENTTCFHCPEGYVSEKGSSICTRATDTDLKNSLCPIGSVVGTNPFAEIRKSCRKCDKNSREYMPYLNNADDCLICPSGSIIDKNNDNIPRRSMRQREKKRNKLTDKENDVVDTLSVLATLARDNTNRNVIRWIHNENYKKVKDS